MKKTLFTLLMFVLIVALLVGCSNNGSAPSGTDTTEGNDTSTSPMLINILTTPTGTPNFAYFAAVAQTVNQHTDLVDLGVVETGGSIVIAEQLRQKVSPMGFTVADVAYNSYNGLGDYEEEQNDDLRILWTMMPTTWHWGVGLDTGITTLEELEGQKFNPGGIGGGGELLNIKIFEALGIQPDFARMQFNDAADQVINGDIIGFSYNGDIPVAKFTEVNAQRPLYFLSATDEQFEVLKEEFPFLIRRTIPADTYAGGNEAETFGLYTATALLAEVPEDVAYEITKAYWENIEEIIAVFPSIEGTKMEDTIENSPIPLHKGAIKYYEEMGLTVPDSLKAD